MFEMLALQCWITVKADYLMEQNIIRRNPYIPENVFPANCKFRPMMKVLFYKIICFEDSFL